MDRGRSANCGKKSEKAALRFRHISGIILAHHGCEAVVSECVQNFNSILQRTELSRAGARFSAPNQLPGQAKRMTSPLVSQALMDATWQRIGGGISHTEIRRLQQACGKPAVFRYVVEAMDEEDTGSDLVNLTDDEFWHMLCILQTVSDCFHDARKSR
jgi:hypothetical protein